MLDSSRKSSKSRTPDFKQHVWALDMVPFLMGLFVKLAPQAAIPTKLVNANLLELQGWSSQRLGLSIQPNYIFPLSPAPKLPHMPHALLRCYPEGFARKLLECFAGRRGLPGHMRHKHPVDVSLTDRQLFERMSLTDPWIDASMCEVWKYLYHNKHVVIPESWTSTMADFDKELTALAFWSHKCFLTCWSWSLLYFLYLSIWWPRFVFLIVNGRNTTAPAANSCKFPY